MSAPTQPPTIRATAKAPPGLCRLLERLFPGAVLVEARPLAPDAAADSGASGEAEETGKASGYGEPLLLRLRQGDHEQRLVFHTATPNEFGHDRRSDRAQINLLSYDTFGRIPRHVRALDVGAIRHLGHGGQAGQDPGDLLSLRDAGEFYLLTTYAEGTVYAEDLRRVARSGAASPLDLARAQALARYLVDLHRERRHEPLLYRRAVRDLVGHGEGIFGVIDGYPEHTPGAPAERLRAIEQRAVEWRWKLRDRAGRLARTHGDFHPFNIVFGRDLELTLLDASRGCVGDPADDVTCLAINYPFFALEHPRAWKGGLGLLWRTFWDTYLEGTHDEALLDVAPPFWAWRALVVANPRFYPALPAEARDRLLTLVERMLAAPRLELEQVEALFQ
ncbi:MAG TPA: aminoglycoside phosphotransferase family protein [Polyangia bacterium]|nr:aminoglycoside phosphotransferase family protein [Polyangia bacterium]